MPIKVACSCGQTFNAPSKYAGKKVKCPKCKNPLVVPTVTAQAKSIEPVASAKIAVKCKCGKSFSANPELAGKKVKCPGCNEPIVIKAGKDLTSEKKKSTTAANPESDGGMDDLFDEIGFNPDDGSKHRKCPACKSPMAAEAILCIQCGYNENLGKKMKVIRPVTADDRAKRADKVADNLEEGGKKKKKGWWGRSK